MFHKRKYKPQHPEKYAGDPTSIIMRSSWETKFALWCDSNKSIIKWSSEETIIPYISPVDGRGHRYFTDFKIETTDHRIFIVEIKPRSQCFPPKRKTGKFLAESATYAINMAKWNAATNYCIKRGWKFIVLTEYELGIK